MPANPTGEGGSGGGVCGRRFRRALRCVERTGSSIACTEQINDFLACERAVFRAALNAKPDAESRQSDRPERRVSPSPPPPRKPEPDSELARQAWSLSDVGDVLGKAVAKQAEACTKLAETVGKPESRASLTQFADRMLEEMGKTVEAVRKIVTRAIADDDDNDSSRKSARDDGDDTGKGQ